VGSVSNMKRNTKQRLYPLTGMLFCAACGWSMRGTTWRKMGYVYKDSSRIELDNGHCGQKVMKAIPLEKQVIKLLYANWTKLNTIEQKRLLRGSVEAIFVRENALVAIQPTFAFLPLFTTFFEGCSKSGPDGRWLGKNQQPEPLIIDPGTSPQEALLLLKIHRDGMSVVLPAED